MTHRYADMNQHDALYKVACQEYPGGVEALAGRMGVVPQVLRNKLAPHCKTHRASWEEVSQIIEFLQEAKAENAVQALHAMNWRHGLVAYPLPDTSHIGDDQLRDGLLNMTKELGEVVSSMQAALADGKITVVERDRVEVEMQQLLAAGAQLRKRFLDAYQEQATHLREVA